ncbi:MAG: MFS transporter [Erysipelotrichaceae bacterium]
MDNAIVNVVFFLNKFLLYYVSLCYYETKEESSKENGMNFSYRKTILIGLAFMSISAFWQVYDGVIPIVLKDSFGLGDTVSGFIMSLDNILALFMLPLFGALSDRVGRRMPFIVVGTSLACILILVLPFAILQENLWFFMIALLAVLFAMGSYRSPAVALMPDLTAKPLRSKANAIINLMGAVGGVISLGLIAFLMPKEGSNYWFLFVSLALVMASCVLLCKLSVKEHANKQQEEEVVAEHSIKLPKDVKRSLILLLCSVSLWFMGYNAVTTAFSKYARFYWGMQGGDFAGPLMVATVAAIVAYLPLGLLSSRFGRKAMIYTGLGLMLLSYGSAFLFEQYTPWLNVVFAITGIGWASINVNSYPMVVEMSKASDVGKFTGYYYTFSMSAQILTPILSGLLLEYVGYHTLFPYAAICVILAMLTMWKVTHGDVKPAAKMGLEALDVGD